MTNPIESNTGSLLLSDYADQIAPTDVLGSSVVPILQGLFGEVGGIMSTAKKLIREKSAYPGFKQAAEEEFGDALWYLAALCRRLKIPLDELFSEAANTEGFKSVGAATDMTTGTFSQVAIPTSADPSDEILFKLGHVAAALLENSPDRTKIVLFARVYLKALHAVKLSFSDVSRRNLLKARGAFLDPKPEYLIDFDKDFGIEEQLPRTFKVRINQRSTGKSYLQWNGVFIGDPLTDSIADPDGYRFHDVFHLAYTAILHWSPVIRALIKHKRKSRPDIDQNQDGGRAIVVEEGVTAWIFTKAKELNFFEGQERISLGILKTVGEFVTGYEVSKCPLKLWEKAILDGYKIFRQVRSAQGGWIIGDRNLRSIQFEPLESEL